MGFLGTLGRLVKGEPVFQDGPGKPAAQPTPQSPQANTAQPRQKTNPQLVIERCDLVRTNQDPDCEIGIRNNSAERLTIKHLRIAGRDYGNGQTIAPGAELEIRIQDRWRNEIKDASLEYVDALGDYFTTYYRVEFRELPGDDYALEDIQFTGFKDT